MGDRLATIDMGRKEGCCCAPLGGGGCAGSPSNTMWPKPTSTSVPNCIHPAVWPEQKRAEKWGCYICLLSGGAGSLSNTMSPWPRPTSVPSGILIYPTVFPQYTNVRAYRQDRQLGSKCSPIHSLMNGPRAWNHSESSCVRHDYTVMIYDSACYTDPVYSWWWWYV